jgi:hypothetical protein
MPRPVGEAKLRPETNIVPRDIFIRLDRCNYCNRPGFVHWDVDLFTCGREVCKSLAFAELRRRQRDGALELPEKRLARSLIMAFDTFDHALRLDEDAEAVAQPEAERIRSRERQETANLLSELRELGRRYPVAPETGRMPSPPPPNPRYRRFVRRGRTAPLRHAA